MANLRGEPTPVAPLLSSTTYKSRGTFLRVFRQVHGHVPAEAEGDGQNSDRRHGDATNAAAAEKAKRACVAVAKPFVAN
jgi:hypothetical protein